MNEKLYKSAPGSNASTPYYYEFAMSEELNTQYQPNFKKLSANRRHNYSKPISMKELLNPKSIQLLIMQSWKTTLNNCQLCETTYPDRLMFYLCKCSHKYCQNCLIEYVSFKINSMQEVRCPDQHCAEKINILGDIYTNLPQELKKKHKRAQLWHQAIANPDIKLCPQQQCEGQVDTKTSPPQCSVCRKYFCQQCMMEKHEGNCDKIYQMTHKEWRRCPSCRMFIAKTQGCNHIRCRCDSEFCFVCLQKWDSTHYKCKQRQQMFYFNVDQVKYPSLVAGLMIAAFPFLALAVGLAVVLAFIIMIPVGAIMGIGYSLLKFYYLMCILIVLLPVGALIGIFVLPFLFTLQKAIPQCIHYFRRYKITLEQLFAKTSQNQST